MADNGKRRNRNKKKQKDGAQPNNPQKQGTPGKPHQQGQQQESKDKKSRTLDIIKKTFDSWMKNTKTPIGKRNTEQETKKIFLEFVNAWLNSASTRGTIIEPDVMEMIRNFQNTLTRGNLLDDPKALMVWSALQEVLISGITTETKDGHGKTTCGKVLQAYTNAQRQQIDSNILNNALNADPFLEDTVKTEMTKILTHVGQYITVPKVGIQTGAISTGAFGGGRVQIPMPTTIGTAAMGGGGKAGGTSFGAGFGATGGAYGGATGGAYGGATGGRSTSQMIAAGLGAGAQYPAAPSVSRMTGYGGATGGRSTSQMIAAGLGAGAQYPAAPSVSRMAGYGGAPQLITPQDAARITAAFSTFTNKFT